MASPAALAAGPLIRLVVIVGLLVAIWMFADFGGLIDQIITELESLIFDQLLGGLI